MSDFDPVEMAERNTRLAAERDAFRVHTDTLRAERDAARAHAAQSQQELDDLNGLFDRMYAADMRGIQAWQAKHPDQPRTWPDRGKLVEWLLDRIMELEKKA